MSAEIDWLGRDACSISDAFVFDSQNSLSRNWLEYNYHGLACMSEEHCDMSNARLPLLRSFLLSTPTGTVMASKTASK